MAAGTAPGDAGTTPDAEVHRARPLPLVHARRAAALLHTARSDVAPDAVLPPAVDALLPRLVRG